jgi:signal transduction histidine kinase
MWLNYSIRLNREVATSVNRWQFIYSRLTFIIAYIGFGILATLVVQLDLWLSGSQLQIVNMLYIWLLGIIILGVALWVEYARWAAYLNHFMSVSVTSSLDELSVLPPPRTYEQTIIGAAWGALYSRFNSIVIQERERGRRNLEMVSQWAHHMKTPVSVIDLELQKAKGEHMTSSSEQFTTVLTSIEEENQRLHQTLQALLNMVRLEEFSADFTAVTIDLIALLRSLINDHKRDFIVHRVYPKLDLEDQADSPIHVVSDNKWLRFILEQILHNAVKYASASDREGHITFRCRRMEQSTVLEIIDNGIGISSQDLPRVFNPFFTGENGRLFPHATGMGLYLAKETCQRLGHSLQITSQPGQGTQVTITFPDQPTTFQDLHVAVTSK